MKTIEEMRNDYDWKEAFAYSKFTMDEVDTVLASRDGANDEQSWLAVFSLKDGRFGYLEAGCDYTGWDCQASGDSATNDTLEGIQRWNLTKSIRQTLGMELPDLDK